MIVVDFYILAESNTQSRDLFCCRLLEKAYAQKQQVYVHCPNESMAHELDELLWTYQPDSFIPHNLYGEGPTPAPFIQIGFDQTPQRHSGVLVNLSPEVPNFHPQFKRICEIIPQTEEDKTLARSRFRYYREHGYKITTHDMTKK